MNTKRVPNFFNTPVSPKFFLKKVLMFSKNVVLGAFLFGMLLIHACSDPESEPKTAAQTAIDGAQVFQHNCVICHGADGKLGLNGAKDLGQSTKTKAERLEIVINGKNLMTPFKNVLSAEEIEAVVEYSFTFGQNK
jgi:cytochrome c6